MSKRLRAGQRRFPPPRPPAQLAVLLLSLGWLLVASPRAQGKLARAGRAHRELWKPRNPFLSPRSILRGHRQPPGQRELHRGALRTPPHPSRALLALLSPSFPSPRGLPAPWGARPGTPPPGPGAVRAPQAAPGWVQGAGCGVQGAGAPLGSGACLQPVRAALPEKSLLAAPLIQRERRQAALAAFGALVCSPVIPSHSRERATWLCTAAPGLIRESLEPRALSSPCSRS